MFKGTISEHSSIAVTFKADHSNNGSSGFFFGFVPKDGSGNEKAQFVPVPPGGGETVEATVPPASTVWSLEIRIDVPDQEGSGRLRVVEDGQEKESRAVTEDVTWTYAVDPSE